MLRCAVINLNVDQFNNLSLCLDKTCNDIELIQFQTPTSELLKQLVNYKPALIFLEYHSLTSIGQEVILFLRKIGALTCVIVEFPNQALVAIKSGAFEFLYKSSSIIDYHIVIEKTKQLFKESKISKQSSLIVTDSKKVDIIPYTNVCHISSENHYSIIHLSNGKKILSNEPLNHYEKLLKEPGFFRVHKSHIVSLEQIKSFQAERTGSIIMRNGSVLGLAARRKKDFIKRFRSFNSAKNTFTN